MDASAKKFKISGGNLKTKSKRGTLKLYKIYIEAANILGGLAG